MSIQARPNYVPSAGDEVYSAVPFVCPCAGNEVYSAIPSTGDDGDNALTVSFLLQAILRREIQVQ